MDQTERNELMKILKDAGKIRKRFAIISDRIMALPQNFFFTDNFEDASDMIVTEFFINSAPRESFTYKIKIDSRYPTKFYYVRESLINYNENTIIKETFMVNLRKAEKFAKELSEPIAEVKTPKIKDPIAELRNIYKDEGINQ